MKEINFEISWNKDKYSVPYTSNVLGVETVSSLAQKLLQRKKANSIEEALEMAKEQLSKLTNRQ